MWGRLSRCLDPMSGFLSEGSPRRGLGPLAVWLQGGGGACTWSRLGPPSCTQFCVLGQVGGGGLVSKPDGALRRDSGGGRREGPAWPSGHSGRAEWGRVPSPCVGGKGPLLEEGQLRALKGWHPSASLASPSGPGADGAAKPEGGRGEGARGPPGFPPGCPPGFAVPQCPSGAFSPTFTGEEAPPRRPAAFSSLKK